jgi:hypothetical protein
VTWYEITKVDTTPNPPVFSSLWTTIVHFTIFRADGTPSLRFVYVDEDDELLAFHLVVTWLEYQGPEYHRKHWRQGEFVYKQIMKKWMREQALYEGGGYENREVYSV